MATQRVIGFYSTINPKTGKAQIMSGAIDIDDFKSCLKKHPVAVEFVKKNGETRKMLCTTCWKWLAENEDEFRPVKSRTGKTSPGHLVAVWDLEEMDYRSIIFDSIKQYEITNYCGLSSFASGEAPKVKSTASKEVKFVEEEDGLVVDDILDSILEEESSSSLSSSSLSGSSMAYSPSHLLVAELRGQFTIDKSVMKLNTIFFDNICLDKDNSFDNERWIAQTDGIVRVIFNCNVEKIKLGVEHIVVCSILHNGCIWHSESNFSDGSGAVCFNLERDIQVSTGDEIKVCVLSKEPVEITKCSLLIEKVD